MPSKGIFNDDEDGDRNDVVVRTTSDVKIASLGGPSHGQAFELYCGIVFLWGERDLDPHWIICSVEVGEELDCYNT